ncbi:phosphate acyltransferase PlsX [Gammaproteobacteria bacterium]|nr:phosphate acyltransferase PlsX [Gammaproteobacteria bacterium]MCH9855098.1 phosphate acyltransferase PlsX [Gammaproteobacteria bacterium]MDA7782624.1 phosphate acyltransferase PlsX [Gammaproteobacteria bacterium]MDA8672335.1 phosphate acyltransferase PlsX [Gammaproteobacteria bacterium]MDA9129669.1 phosphate acyltransferase PlsX [Gammaproteobacteria bacterium]
MNSSKCIAIDAMGGEGGPSTTVAATLLALQQNPMLSVILVGNEREIRSSAPALEAFSGRYDIVHTPKTFLDTDKPASILRSGRDSSLYRCVEIHQQGQASAVVSAGNTGALLLLGRHLLKTVEGVELPAIVATLPDINSKALLLDVGANLACSPRQLEQFAIMGAVLAQKQFGCTPRVALLNVGAEEYKGTADVQQTARLLETQETINFSGFVEANAVFEGHAEVIVCDGFVGNVMIKASAGAVNALISQIISNITVSEEASIKAVYSRLNPQRFNGATLLGLQGNIVKSHGNADIFGFSCAINQAYNEQRDAIPSLIREAIASAA